MQIKMTKGGRLTAEERRELKDAEARGFLIVPEYIHEEFLTGYFGSCSRNSRNAVELEPAEGALRRITIHAYNLKAHFQLVKDCAAIGWITGVNPYSGHLGVVVDTSAGEGIAKELAASNSAHCTERPPSPSGVTSGDIRCREILTEWLMHVPIALPNWALLQLLGAGKIRSELEVIDGREVVMFKSLGSLDEVDAFLQTCHTSEATTVTFFVRRKVDFLLDYHEEKPAICLRYNPHSGKPWYWYLPLRGN